MRILVIDNYDSFVYTLAGYLAQLGAQVEVERNDAFDEGELDEVIGRYDAVVLSPGPGNPAQAGISLAVVERAAASGTPLLGVCLGHQAIAEHFGATVTHAAELMHGRTSQVRHDHDPLFEGLSDPFTATRYHSLAVAAGTVPEELAVTARTEEGIVMALRHRTKPLTGVQFHPESVLTEGGYRLLANWLGQLGFTEALTRAEGLSPLVQYAKTSAD